VPSALGPPDGEAMDTGSWAPLNGPYSRAVGIFEPVIETLNRAGVRYVVVGGFAVVLHGHARLTADLDLALDLSPNEARKGIDALMEMGLRARAPVDAEDLADAAARARWRDEKHMRVLSMWDPQQPLRVVDVFVDNPIDFDLLWQRSELVDLATTAVRVASIPDLMRMKELAGRPQDHSDIAALRAILEEKGE
jgi:Nucleotidyl transferase AbiEii toxin, Type IV TA system